MSRFQALHDLLTGAALRDLPKNEHMPNRPPLHHREQGDSARQQPDLATQTLG
jgi:hypothetical protein